MAIRVRAFGPVGERPETGGALIPVPAVQAPAWQSRGPVHGAPGTQPVPAPHPAAIPPGIMRRAAGGIGDSADYPGPWYPQIWYQPELPGAPLERAPVQYLNSSHELPVPAIQARNITVARGVNVTPRVGGQSGVAQPRVTQRWPRYKGPGSV